VLTVDWRNSVMRDVPTSLPPSRKLMPNREMDVVTVHESGWGGMECWWDWPKAGRVLAELW
jgi:hypothetical protein